MGFDPLSPLELWGGHECTVNRVGDAYFDQTQATGHQDRIADLELFAELGISKLRYPVLWERVSPRYPDQCEWEWSDARLGRIKALGMHPIVGLVHHGSGPRYTDLLSADFATGLAEHARRTAERYNWVEDWTPVNEPLTTARFSLLYGHWFPHRRDEGAFWEALLNQVDGVRLSMRAVRMVNSHARLIQTEDLGHSYATAPLAKQAEFDNLRRWASWDLLCGRLTREHPLWGRIAAFGLGDRLLTIADDPCPPDVVGINHYLTSDRFLDHRLERYPDHCHGHCSFGAIADVEAVRVLGDGHSGLEGAVREAADRYQLPIAITEIHNGCTREEQMRWMHEAWRTTETLRQEGVDVRAITAWSLLGAFGWDGLLTGCSTSYECGVYDLRGSSPRPTAMVPLLRSIAAGDAPVHAVLDQPGWWKRPERLHYPPHPAPSVLAAIHGSSLGKAAPLLITGATGTLGQAFAAACRLRNIPHLLTDRSRLPIDDASSISCLLDDERPWAVINTAGWVRVDEAEHDIAGCMRANRDGSLLLASACAARDIPYVTFSSDMVFDGCAESAYVEGDELAPLSVYGRSKAEADTVLLGAAANVLVVRTAAFFSPHDVHNFAMHIVGSLREELPVVAASDCSISPTYVPDLVRTTLDLLIDGEVGLWHLVNDGSASWADFGREIAKAAGLTPALVQPVPASEMGWTARRPPRGEMRSIRGSMMPSLDDAIGRFAAHVRRA